jgi:hypothetical protein
MRCLGFSTLVILWIAGIAHAAPNYTLSIGVAGGKATCEQAKDTPQGATTTTSLQVKLVPVGDVKILDVTSDSGTPVVLSPDGSGQVATIRVDALKTDSLTLTVNTNHGSKTCKALQARLGDGGDTSTGAIDDDTAARWWLSEAGIAARDSLTRNGRSRGLPDDAVVLVHLPSGKPAFPNSTSVREGTVVQIAVIQPNKAAPSVEFVPKNCAAFKAFRVDGDSGDAAEKHGGRTGITTTDKDLHLELSAKGPFLRCGAGVLNYDLVFKSANAEAVTSAHTVDVRPVYSFALLTTLGFDTTIQRDFQTIPAEGGSLIARKHDRVGPTVLIGGQWMLGGVDYTDMRWYNHVLNPFIAVDAAAPLTGFVIGDTLTISGGISLGIGLAAHEGARLEGARVGDLITGGDVPKRNTWHDQRLGFFIGVAFDSKAYEALKAH